MIAALEQQAWDRYTQERMALAQVPGFQLGLFLDQARVANEWRGVWLACMAELDRVGQGPAPAVMCGSSDTAHLYQVGTPAP